MHVKIIDGCQLERSIWVVDFMLFRAAFGSTTGSSTTLVTTVTGGRRRFPVPVLGSVTCTTTTAIFTGTAPTVPSVFRFVASGIKGGELGAWTIGPLPPTNGRGSNFLRIVTFGGLTKNYFR